MKKNMLLQTPHIFDLMKRVGLHISDAKLQFELMEALKKEKIPFEIIQPGKKIPKGICTVLTTDEDQGTITCHRQIICTSENIGSCIMEAKATMASRGSIRSLVIGIDPGRKPGIAVMADQVLVETAQVRSPEAVAELVIELLRVFKSEEQLVRIGHGDKTRRNRIFNSLWDLDIPIEIVDERNTSTTSDHRDIDAAIEIALTPGYRPKRKQLVMPSNGEISDIQRISRLRSNGELTISRALAESVAKGEIPMEEAIEVQRSQKKDAKG
ncbi:MAG TPA: hypothetical protein ENN25_05560 [Euryarchaeota archaeon]|nr:hypothetical protein [Euryarchaeota archaeon]